MKIERPPRVGVIRAALAAAQGDWRRGWRRRIAGISRIRDSGRVWLGFWVEEHAPDAVNTTAGLARGADMAGSGRSGGAAARRSVEHLRTEQSEREEGNGSKRISTSTRNSGRAQIREGSDETAVRRRLRAPSSTMARLLLRLGFGRAEKRRRRRWRSRGHGEAPFIGWADALSVRATLRRCGQREVELSTL